MLLSFLLRCHVQGSTGPTPRSAKKWRRHQAPNVDSARQPCSRRARLDCIRLVYLGLLLCSGLICSEKPHLSHFVCRFSLPTPADRPIPMIYARDSTLNCVLSTSFRGSVFFVVPPRRPRVKLNIILINPRPA